MPVMESVRADARQRKRQRTTGQGELFGSEALYDSTHFEFLRKHYESRSQTRVLNLLQAKGRVNYDNAWDTALQEPLVWESDLKVWIKRWVKEGRVRIDGLTGKQQTPKRGHNHYLVWGGSGKRT